MSPNTYHQMAKRYDVKDIEQDNSVPDGYVRDNQTGTIYRAETWLKRQQRLLKQK